MHFLITSTVRCTLFGAMFMVVSPVQAFAELPLQKAIE